MKTEEYGKQTKDTVATPTGGTQPGGRLDDADWLVMRQMLVQMRDLTCEIKMLREQLEDQESVDASEALRMISQMPLGQQALEAFEMETDPVQEMADKKSGKKAHKKSVKKQSDMLEAIETAESVQASAQLEDTAEIPAEEQAAAEEHRNPEIHKRKADASGVRAKANTAAGIQPKAKPAAKAQTEAKAKAKVHTEAKADTDAKEQEEETAEQPKKKNKALSIISNLLFYVIIIAVVFGAFLLRSNKSGRPFMIAGYSAMTVLTGSMEEVYPQGSLIVTKSVDAEELEIGDDITFMTGESSSVTHRIIGIVENYADTHARGFETQGVMNAKPDKDIVAASNVVGQVIFCSTLLGQIAVFISTNWPFLLFVLVILIALITFLQWNAKR